MRVHFVNDTPMQWVENYKRFFGEQVWTEKPMQLGADVTVFMWCNQDIIDYVNKMPKTGKWVVFVRRYEAYRFDMSSVDWKKVDRVIAVNDYIGNTLREHSDRVEVVYNGIDPDKWTYRKRGHGDNVAWVGYINQKKDPSLAFQVMSLLSGYTLHMAGAIQDTQVMTYMKVMARKLKIKVTVHNHIPHEHMDEWLEDKDYILNTSISEGCPNSVIEAMAKGIKPVVHAWPGAEEQFGEYVFSKAGDAVNLFRGEYDSDKYRNIACEKFGLNQYKRVLEICEGLCATREWGTRGDTTSPCRD